MITNRSPIENDTLKERLALAYQPYISHTTTVWITSLNCMDQPSTWLGWIDFSRYLSISLSLLAGADPSLKLAYLPLPQSLPSLSIQPPSFGLTESLTLFFKKYLSGNDIMLLHLSPLLGLSFIVFQ